VQYAQRATVPARVAGGGGRTAEPGAVHSLRQLWPDTPVVKTCLYRALKKMPSIDIDLILVEIFCKLLAQVVKAIAIAYIGLLVLTWLKIRGRNGKIV
jgi:hypothetical protein